MDEQEIVDLSPEERDAELALMDNRRTHKMLTKALRGKLPALHSIQGDADEAMVIVKFFAGSMTWYAIEFDPQTGDFFGLVDGQYVELGSFNLYILGLLTVPPFGMPIERDCYWTPVTLGECRKRCTGIQYGGAMDQ